MAIGVPLKVIYHTTLSELSAYDEAQKLKDKMMDQWCWIMGVYAYEAVGVAIENKFSGKGSKPVKYREKPFLANKELTKEEKIKQLEALFGKLEVRKANFNRLHGEK